jgi:hypothetical protein
MPRQPKRASTPDSKLLKRQLHAHGDLRTGLSELRPRVPASMVPSFVDELAGNRIYRLALCPQPFPRDFARVKAPRLLMQIDDALELLWLSCILKPFSP